MNLIAAFQVLSKEALSVNSITLLYELTPDEVIFRP